MKKFFVGTLLLLLLTGCIGVERGNYYTDDVIWKKWSGRATVFDDLSYTGIMLTCKRETAEFCSTYVGSLSDEEQKELLNNLELKIKTFDKKTQQSINKLGPRQGYCPPADQNFSLKPFFIKLPYGRQEIIKKTKHDIVIEDFIYDCMKKNDYRWTWKTEKELFPSIELRGLDYYLIYD